MLPSLKQLIAKLQRVPALQYLAGYVLLLSVAVAVVIQQIIAESIFYFLLIPLALAALTYQRWVAYLGAACYTVAGLVISFILRTSPYFKIEHVIIDLFFNLFLIELALLITSEHRNLERTYQKANEQFSLIYNGVSDGILVMKSQGMVTDANQEAMRMLGRDRATLKSMNISSLVPNPAEIPNLRELPAHPIEMTFIGANEHEFSAEVTWRSQITGDERLIFAVVRDITERQRQNQINALRFELGMAYALANDTSQLWDLTVQNLQSVGDLDGIAVFESLDNGHTMNLLASFGIEQEIISTTITQQITGAPRSGYKDALVWSAGAERVGWDHPFFQLTVRNSAGWQPIQLEKELIGGIAYFSRSRQDIPGWMRLMMNTISGLLSSHIARIRAESSLEQAQHRFGKTFERAQIGLFQTTPSGEIITINQACAEILGYSSIEELIEHNNGKVSNLYELPSQRSEFLKTIEVNGSFEAEISLLNRSGVATPVYASSWKVTDSINGQVYIEGFLLDISDRQRNMDRLSLLNNIQRDILAAQEVFDIVPGVMQQIHARLDYAGVLLIYNDSANNAILFYDTRQALKSGSMAPQILEVEVTQDMITHLPKDAQLIGVKDQLTAHFSTLIGEMSHPVTVAPITINHRTLGALFFLLDNENQLQEELVFTTQIASALSIGIQDSQLRTAEREARDQAEIQAGAIDMLRYVAETLNQASSLSEALESGLDIMLTLTGAPIGWILLQDAHNMTRPAASRGLPESFQDMNCNMLTGDCHCLRQLDARETHSIELHHCWLLDQMQAPGAENLRVITTPLIAGRNVLGTLNIAVQMGGELNDSTLSLLNSASGQFGAALERARLFEQLQRLAARDPLTDLYNRRYFFEHAMIEFQRSRRYNKPLCVLLLDLDHFKQINDRYGHLVGDRVLINIARTFKDNLRSVDMLGRYGGEEFAVVLPETNLEGAYTIAERLRQRIAEEPMIIEAYRIPVHVSIGCAELDGSCNTIEEILNRADIALYQAKQSGRNQVCVWSRNQISTGSEISA